MSSETCMSLSCGQLQKLIEKVEEPNRTQTAALLAINLANKLSEQHLKSVKGSSSLVLPTYNAVQNSDQRTRSRGYINWNESYHFLKNHVWLEASIIGNYCYVIEESGNSNCTSFANLTDMKYTVSIHETKRFPTVGAHFSEH